jgi:NADH-quinone oxidoreductase subunit F
MKKLLSIEDFNAFEKELSHPGLSRGRTIVIPASTCSQASGANDLIRIAKRELLNRGLVGKIILRITGCHGFCQMEPNVLIEPDGTFYPRVTMDNMVRIVEAVSKGEVLEDLLYRDPGTGEPIAKARDIPFFAMQVRTILGQNEKVDPTRIGTYIAEGGYAALSDILARWEAAQVIEEIKESGLRGRGGAGFPTGRKWEMLASQPNGRGKFLVCNADEGDPGAYMDRAILEGNPHSIIEGMLIGAFATGATGGFVYVRNEYPLAIKNLGTALRQAREIGLLGERILGTGFSFDINIVRGAGAFVCGEETALVRSIEGKMGEPQQRPPFPIEKGIEGKPTAINNVETWANIPVILRQGAGQFRAVGVEGNTGTKIFSLVGKIRNTGLVEVPMGITVREIIEGIGGGPENGVPIKAVQTGGPSGGCIPASQFNLPVSFDSLASAGSIMGSGGMIVMDENTCMVDVAKYFMSFMKDESCGKCFVCRKGTQRIGELLDDISKGRAAPDTLDLLEELAVVVRDTSLCGLGQSSVNSVLSTLKYFREEYERHVIYKKCPAYVCKDLVGAPCQASCPLGTEAWRYIALLADGELKKAYQVIRETNPLPSVCARVCDHKCEERCSQGTTGGQAIAIRALKRFITDNVDASVYEPVHPARPASDRKVAVIGSGPAGLVAAHYLSLQGYRVTVFEAASEPGGLLVSGIPPYRLPRDVLSKEIQAIIDGRITVRCGVKFGPDFGIDRIFEDGFSAVFLALGAHKSLKLNLKDEELNGIFPALQFLKAFNLEGKELARGRVGVIGGGNSAVDAARAALRQEQVESVTVLYRRTREEMPAFREEVEAALHEGIALETLVTPVSIHSENGRLKGVEFCKNKPGSMDAGGRRQPVPLAGTEFMLQFDTLIVAVGEKPDIGFIHSMGIEVGKKGTLLVDPETCVTSRPGVFAGGDAAGGPHTVVDAMAAGKRGAIMIGRYLRGEDLKQPHTADLPRVYIAPRKLSEAEMGERPRAEPPTLPVGKRMKNFAEVELTLAAETAMREARRCLRCDLHFTRPDEKQPVRATEGENI